MNLKLKAILYLMTPPALWKLGRRIFRRGKSTNEDGSFIDNEFLGSYSQYGEDLIIDALLGCPKSGCYVDIGANDPVFLSNTLRFYERGWRGINVEPEPNLFVKLSERRAQDINLNVGIGTEAGSLTFYRIQPSQLSTFNADQARKNLKRPGATALQEMELPVVTLSHLFEEHLGERRIDFLSVDVEGFELEVFRGNDWAKFRPRLILVEINPGKESIVTYLHKVTDLLGRTC